MTNKIFSQTSATMKEEDPNLGIDYFTRKKIIKNKKK